MGLIDWLRGFREVYTTFSMEQFVKAKERLDEEQIPYEVRSKATDSLSRNRGGASTPVAMLGHFGERMDMSTQYYIYVRKEQAEYAAHLLRR